MRKGFFIIIIILILVNSILISSFCNAYNRRANRDLEVIINITKSDNKYKIKIWDKTSNQLISIIYGKDFDRIWHSKLEHELYRYLRRKSKEV